MTTEGKSLFVHTCIKITIKRKIKKLIYIKSTVDFVGLDTFDSENYFVIENLKWVAFKCVAFKHSVCDCRQESKTVVALILVTKLSFYAF